ncbi:MAG: hypothetical protein MUF71_14295 [Candidatus Kapabacteria bacterium]|jgi:hypothetical protein|nr:hypothetical protein [Candidatus Kapabacteria bacterium]
MRFELKITRTLIYYDTPQLFLAQDKVGTLYLCLLVDDSKYLVVSISKNRLFDFEAGKIDLRSLFELPEANVWFTTNEYTNSFIVVQFADFEIVPEEYLPEQGFFLEQTNENEEIIAEAKERNKPIVHLSLSDSSNEHSIDAYILSDFVKLFQNWVKHIFKKMLLAENKKEFDFTHNYNLRVFATSPGSLNIHLESNATQDIFGTAVIETALAKIEEVTQNFDNSENYIATLKTIKGHSISAYRKIIGKVIDDKIRLKYQWYSLSSDKIHQGEINHIFAEKVLAILKIQDDLSKEMKEFSGSVKQADVTKGNWRILHEPENKEYSGIAASSRILDGITLETQKYKFICEEKISVDRVTEREKIEYSLISIEKI